jgi:hypothetical protein
MNIHTNDPLVSPVFASEFIAWARLDDDDPMIDTCLLSATSAVFAFTKQDMLTRTWTLTYSSWPIYGSAYTPSISPQNYGYTRCVELPYTNLVSVDSVTVNGEENTDYRITQGKPCLINFNSVGTMSCDNDALSITYKAGYGESTADTPQPIRNAIMMAATYIHAHNGACDYSDALTMSGAKQLIVPYAVKAGIVI